MSSAIKRLSTIIRPGSASNPTSPAKEPTKDALDAAAPVAPASESAPVNAETAEPATTATANGNGTTTAEPAVKDAVATAAPEEGAAAVPAPTNEAAATETSPAEKKDKEAKPPPSSHRRDPRDIGRSTIKRFSTILRSQGRDVNKDVATQEEAKPAEGETPAEATGGADAKKTDEAVKVTDKENAAPATEKKDATPAAKTSTPPSATKDKGAKDASVGKRRSSSFFTAAREGFQRSAKVAAAKPAKAKPAPKVEAVTSSKILKKGAAKGKRVIVITGASRGVGLEFVKQFAKQPDTFVIALSRTADKSTVLRPIITSSAKHGHNVRALKLDITSTRSMNSVVKDIVELTDGRIDLLINAAGSRGDHALKVWDIKGNELENDLRNNLVGPITFVNALIPYLKPFPPKEVKKEDKKEEKAEAKEEKKEEKAEAKEEKKEEKAEAKAENADAKVEQLEAKEAKLDGKDQEHTTLTTVEPTIESPIATAGVPETSAAPVVEQTTTEAAPAAEPSPENAPPIEPTAVIPEPVVAPAFLPEQPFVIFLTPADPIHNAGGSVSAGSTFVPTPRTLFSLSRAALQVAIGKYAVGLGGRGVGVVGVERVGLDDPYSTVTDEQAAASVVKLLPSLSVRDNGKLLRGSA